MCQKKSLSGEKRIFADRETGKRMAQSLSQTMHFSTSWRNCILGERVDPAKK